MSYAGLTLVGRLGNDPELRYTPSAQAVTTLNVAVNRKFKKADETPVEETTWFRVSVWGKQAENCAAYLARGRQVLIIGRLTPDENGGPKVWTRADGTPGASYDMVAQDVRFLGSGNGGGEEAAPEAGSTDDIPF